MNFGSAYSIKILFVVPHAGLLMVIIIVPNSGNNESNNNIDNGNNNGLNFLSQ